MLNELVKKFVPISKLNYRNIFESMTEGFAYCQMIYDKSGSPIDFRYLYVNAAFTEQTGLPAEKVIGRTVKQVIPKIEPSWIETYNSVVQSGKSKHFENRVKSLGKYFEIRVWSVGTGQFCVIFSDITDRKIAEK